MGLRSLIRFTKLTRYTKIRSTIIIGFFILGLIVILTSAIGVFFITNVVKVLNDVTDYAAPLAKNTDDLIANLLESDRIAREILASSDSSEVMELIVLFDSLNVQFSKSGSEVENLLTDKNLKKNIRTAFSRQQRFNSIAHAMFSHHHNSLKLEIEVVLLLEKIDSTRSRLLSELDRIVSEDEANKDKNSQDIENDNILVLNAARNLQGLIIQLQKIFRDYLNEENPEQLNALESEYQNLIYRGEQLVELIESQAASHRLRAQGFRSHWNSWRDLVIAKEGLFSKYRAQRMSESNALDMVDRFEGEAEVAIVIFENIVHAANSISNKAGEQKIVVTAPTVLYVTLFFSIVIIFFLGLLIVQFITSSARQIEHTMENLESSQEQLSKLAGYLQEIREEERALISHEIHDELGQALTALQIDAALISRELPEESEYLRMKVKSMIELIQETLLNVQKISSILRPAMLDQLGLESAIKWYIDEFQRRTGLECHLQYECQIPVDNEKVVIALFRILQESLTNVARHAHATTANIHLNDCNGTIKLVIDDNGCGITEEKIHDITSFGLLGMKERVKSLHGTFAITGSGGSGTIVAVSIPT